MIRSMRQMQAAGSVPVRLQGTVLFYDDDTSPDAPCELLFISDGTAGIYVDVPFGSGDLHLEPGQDVLVQGRTLASNFAPIIEAEKVTPFSTRTLLHAAVVSSHDVLSSREDCRWAALEGTVREDEVSDERRRMVLLSGGRRFPVYFAGSVQALVAPHEHVGDRVIIRGVAAGVFTNDGQITYARLFCPGPGYVQVVQAGPVDKFAAPACPVAGLAALASADGDPKLVRVSGAVTCDWPGHLLCLWDGTHGVVVKSSLPQRMALGEQVEAVGFPMQRTHGTLLEDGIFRQQVSGPVPQPVEVDAAGVRDVPEGRLVTIEARLMDRKLGQGREDFLLQTGDNLVTAKLAADTGRLDNAVRLGDTLKVTGVLSREDVLDEPGQTAWRPPGFQLLLRSPQDIALVPFWTPRRVLELGLAGLGVLALALLWIVALRRNIAQQKLVIEDQVRCTATLEERNRIARELHDTLAQGFAGTAFVLEGIATGLKQEGHALQQPSEMALRMVRHSLTEARRSLMNLRADMLEHRDLQTALRDAARDLGIRSPVKLILDLQPLDVALTPLVENNFFRIGVEAMTNALRHGHAQTLEVKLSHRGGLVTLVVWDDGEGFDPAAPGASTGHFGVQGMRERAGEMGATLEIRSAPGAGTMVTLSMRAITSARANGHAPRIPSS